MSVEMSYSTSDQRSPITAIAGTSAAVAALGGSINSPNTIHPSEWSLQQVIQWLQTLQPTSIANQHASKFREHGIEGDVLLELDTEALGDMGITSIGHRLAILRGVYELKKRWNIELEPDSWRPDVQSISEGRVNNSALSAYSFLSSSSNGISSATPQAAIADLVRALYERDERLWTLEQEVARLYDWLVRYTDDSTHSAKTIEALRPYLPPSKPPSNLSYIAQTYLRERRSFTSSSGNGNGNLQVHGNYATGTGTDADGSGSSSGRGSKTPLTATGFRSVHESNQSHSPYGSAPGNASQTGFSPTTSTPGATPTNAHPPISIANDASKANPLVTTTFVPGSAGGLSASSSGTLSGSLLQASPPSVLGSAINNNNNPTTGSLTVNAAGSSLSPSSPFSVGSSDGRKEKNTDSAGLPNISASGTSGSAGSSKATGTGSSGSGSGGSASDTPYKSFRVTLDDPCYKVLPAALKKYKIDDDWRQYALFICYGSTERCLSYDEKPLLLFQKLKENKQSPVFMLRHIRDVKSPIAIASAKAAARKTLNGSGPTNGDNEATGKSSSSKSSVSKVADAVAKFGGTTSGKDTSGNDAGGGSGDKGQDSGAFIDSVPGQPRLTGPAAQLIDGKTTDGGGRGAASAASASGSDTYAIAIYPYVSEREDEFDVAVGDTFIVKSKAKGWWVVQRDARAKGHPIVEGVVRNIDGTPRNGGEIKSGWVPAGCLLETRQPLSSIVTLPQGEGGDPIAAQVLNSPTSPKTPQAGSRMEDGQAKELASFMASVPIPPSLITSTSTPGILLMDYNNTEEKLHLKKDQRLRVFKRYNHWSYCVEEGGSHTRAWLPSWYIGKVGGSSRSGNSSSSRAAAQSSSSGGGSANGNNTVPLTI
jgi:protein STE50